MFEQFKNGLIQWKSTTSERQKLQHTYIVAAASIVVIAGLVSLLDFDLGQDIVVLAGVALASFLLNAVVWSVLENNVLNRITSKVKKTK